jgi:uncharacterized protein YifN (PemK superfamily)
MTPAEQARVDGYVGMVSDKPLPPLATRAEILQEIGRELAIRRDCFPRWVQQGKLTQKLADERINRMQAAYEYLMNHMPDDSPQSAMFK